ncbi:MAG: hypothetical protein ACRC4X_07595 [Cetobacterium sp.]
MLSIVIGVDVFQLIYDALKQRGMLARTSQGKRFRKSELRETAGRHKPPAPPHIHPPIFQLHHVRYAPDVTDYWGPEAKGVKKNKTKNPLTKKLPHTHTHTYTYIHTYTHKNINRLTLS